jgi:serine/threonine protein kinase
VYAPFSFELLARRAGRAISGIARFIEMAIQICVPLRQMHLQNLIHGDIKPGSIFVHHDATCRLGSFGLSSSLSDAFTQTRLAVSGGTPAYMSPEHTTRTQRPSTAAAISTASAWCCMNS